MVIKKLVVDRKEEMGEEDCAITPPMSRGQSNRIGPVTWHTIQATRKINRGKHIRSPRIDIRSHYTNSNSKNITLHPPSLYTKHKTQSQI